MFDNFFFFCEKIIYLTQGSYKLFLPKFKTKKNNK